MLAVLSLEGILHEIAITQDRLTSVHLLLLDFSIDMINTSIISF